MLPVAFAVASFAAAGLLPDLGNLWQVVQNLFFFLAGLRLRDPVVRFAASTGVLRALALAAAFAGATAAAGVLGMRAWPGVWPVLGVVAVVCGVAVCALSDRHAAVLARPLRWIGQRTLPIYVLHMIPLALIDQALRASGWRAIPVVEAIAPVVLTAVVIAVCLSLHAVLVRVRLGVLFDPLLLWDRLRRDRRLAEPAARRGGRR